MDNPKEAKKIVYAGDTYFCCHEFKEISVLDMELLDVDSKSLFSRSLSQLLAVY
jgi:hypothetical protein